MVKEVIKRIEDAENKAQEIGIEAEEMSISLIDDVLRQSEEIKAEAKKEALSISDKMMDDKRRQYEEKDGEISQKIDDEIKEIETRAKSMEKAAIDEIIDNFY